MFAWAFVNVVIAPGVLWDAFEVRSVPAGDIARLDQEVIESIATFGVEPCIYFECVEGGFEISDLGLGGCDTGLFAATHDFGINNGGKRCQDDQNEQHFDQGKALRRGSFDCTVFDEASIHVELGLLC